MNEDEWKREDEVEIAEEVHTTRYLNHLRSLRAVLRPTRVGGFLFTSLAEDKLLSISACDVST